jgi:hypothetical protein
LAAAANDLAGRGKPHFGSDQAVWRGELGRAGIAAGHLAQSAHAHHHGSMEQKAEQLPKRRKNVQHFNEPGDAHFFTFSCYQRMALLSKDRTRWWLLEAVEDAREKHRFDLWAWVFMPEHVVLKIDRTLPILIERLD